MGNRFPVISAALAIASLTMGTVFSVAVPASAQRVVTCESNNRDRSTCPIDARGGSVRLVEQLSSTSCNGNWGYKGNRIWVRNGCRARFAVGSRGYNGYNNGYNGYNNGYNNGYGGYRR